MVGVVVNVRHLPSLGFWFPQNPAFHHVIVIRLRFTHVKKLRLNRTRWSPKVESLKRPKMFVNVPWYFVWFHEPLRGCKPCPLMCHWYWFLPGNFLAKPKPLSFKGGKRLLFSADFQPRMSSSGLIFCKKNTHLKIIKNQKGIKTVSEWTWLYYQGNYVTDQENYSI